MKSHQEPTAFKPVTITFETQEEIDSLSNALYHDLIWAKTSELPERLGNAILNFRCEIFDYSSEAYKLSNKLSTKE